MSGSRMIRIGMATVVLAAGVVRAGPIAGSRPGGPAAAEMARRAVEPGRAVARARAAVDRARARLGLRRDEELAGARVRGGFGTTHVRFAQVVDGIPVEGAEIRVHFDRRGRCQSIESTWRPGAAPPGLPRLGAEEATGVARAWVESAAEGEPGPIRHAGLTITRCGELVHEIRARVYRPPMLLRIQVDARTGAIVDVRDLIRHAEGRGAVFLTNPIVALKDPSLRDMGDRADAVPEAAYRIVALPGLDGTGTLTGPYVTTEGTPNRVIEPTLEFLYDRSQPGFEEVMAYYHIDAVARYLLELGLTDAPPRPIQVFVNSQPPGVPLEEDSSFFQPVDEGEGVIALGKGGADDAEDAEIIIHEYGHAIQHHQEPFFGLRPEGAALAEGFCDFLATAFLSQWSDGYGDLCFGEWDARNYPGGFACHRTIPEFMQYPEDLRHLPHADGRIWSSALWALLGRIGREKAIALAVEANFFLRADARFRDAGRALLEADAAIFDAEHAPIIQAILEPRGLLIAPVRSEEFRLAAGLPARIPDDSPEGVESAIDWYDDTTIESEHSILVYVDIDHDFPPDLAVTLTAPDGSRYCLTPPTEFPAFFGAAVRPRDPFLPLAGRNARGTWTLTAADTAWGDTGTLEAWGLRIVNLTRGEANGDDHLDVGDAITVLQFMFADGSLPCRTVADINDNGFISLDDPILLLMYLYAGGDPPREPFQKAGADPTPDSLSCPLP